MGRLNKLVKRAKHKAKSDRYKHTIENSFYIVPLKWNSGFIDLSELGNNTQRIELENQMSWEKVFTGKENLTVLWDQALELWSPFEGDAKQKYPFQMKKVLRQWFWDKTKQECVEDKSFANKQKSTFKTWEETEKDKNTKQDIGELSRGCGRFFLGAVTSNQITGIYGNNLIANDFINFVVEESVRVYTSYEIKHSDIFEFIYVIPQISSQFLFIDNVEKVWLETDFYVNSITFRSINKRISKSGKAIDQFINWGAPGDTILKPVVKGNTLIFDSAFMRDIPTKKIQLDFNGLVAFGSVMLMGRPAKFDVEYGEGHFNHYLERPRMLLPYKLNEPYPNELLIKKQAETSYYAAPFKLSLVDYIKEWSEEWTRDATGEFLSRWEGTIEPTNHIQMLNSNPEAKEDNLFRYSLYDPNFKFNFNNVNPITLDATFNPYCRKNLTIRTPTNVPTFLCHNYFAMSAFKDLPLEKKSITSWAINKLPIIGGILQAGGWMFNWLGIPSGWRNEQVRLSAKSVPLLMPTIAPNYGSAFKPGKGLNYPWGKDSRATEWTMPLEIFASQNESDQFIYSGVNASSASFNITLTDQYYDENNKIRTTTDLGYEHEWNDKCRPAPPKENGYIIDTLNFQVLGKTNVGITFQTFGDYQIWTGTYKTNAMYSNSIRNWTNTLKFSFYELFQNVIIKYPGTLVEPKPPKYKDLEIDLIDETIKPPPSRIDISKLFNNFKYDNRTTRREVTLYLRSIPGLEQITEDDFRFEIKKAEINSTGLLTIIARKESKLIYGEKDLIIEALKPPPPPPPPPKEWKRIDWIDSPIRYDFMTGPSNNFEYGWLETPPPSVMRYSIDIRDQEHNIKPPTISRSNDDILKDYGVIKSEVLSKYKLAFHINGRNKTFIRTGDKFIGTLDAQEWKTTTVEYYMSPNFSINTWDYQQSISPVGKYGWGGTWAFRQAQEVTYDNLYYDPESITKSVTLRYKMDLDFVCELEAPDNQVRIKFTPKITIQISNKPSFSVWFRLRPYVITKQYEEWDGDGKREWSYQDWMYKDWKIADKVYATVSNDLEHYWSASPNEGFGAGRFNIDDNMFWNNEYWSTYWDNKTWRTVAVVWLDSIHRLGDRSDYNRRYPGGSGDRWYYYHTKRIGPFIRKYNTKDLTFEFPQIDKIWFEPR